VTQEQDNPTNGISSIHCIRHGQVVVVSAKWRHKPGWGAGAKNGGLAKYLEIRKYTLPNFTASQPTTLSSTAIIV